MTESQRIPLCAVNIFQHSIYSFTVTLIRICVESCESGCGERDVGTGCCRGKQNGSCLPLKFLPLCFRCGVVRWHQLDFSHWGIGKSLGGLNVKPVSQLVDVGLLRKPEPL